MTVTALHEAIIAPPVPGNPRNSEASVVELRDGRLLLAWSRFTGGMGSDFDTADVAAMISADGGRTWGQPYVLQENIGKLCTYSPTLLRLQSGALGFTCFVKNSGADNRVYWRKSTDDGQTWSAPQCITPKTMYYCLNNERAIQLRNGRIIVPLSYVPVYYHTAPFIVLCIFSDDEGQTWHEGATEIHLPKRGADEPGVVERKDGSLLMTIRTQLADQYRAESFDGGSTWVNVRPMGLVGSEAPATIVRIPRTGDLLCVWNRVFNPFKSHYGRSPLNSALSRDDGETWANVRDIENNPNESYAYTSILFRGDEVLLTYYVHTIGTRDIGLKLKILPLDWFYASEAEHPTGPGDRPT